MRQWIIFCGEADTSTYSEGFYVWLAVNLEDHMLLLVYFLEAEAGKAEYKSTEARLRLAMMSSSKIFHDTLRHFNLAQFDADGNGNSTVTTKSASPVVANQGSDDWDQGQD